MSEELTNKLLRASMANDELQEFAVKEIDRLTAELAAKDEWTPITSVEQVEGLAAGVYELRDIERGVWCPATKKSSGVWQLVIGGAMPVDSTLAASEINDRYREYKLIRAFEPAAPSIPEGAIENTLENREKAAEGDYVFVFPEFNRIAQKRGDRWQWNGDRNLPSDSQWFIGCEYFREITTAALEALAKEQI